MDSDGNQWRPITNSTVAVTWTREEDKIFERALLKFPDGVDDRWRKIADQLPNKSPDDVMVHYEALLHDICAIESGRVELPRYPDDPEWDDGATPESPGRISFGSPFGNRSTQPDIRKKGVPWTEEEHRLFLRGLSKYGRGDWRSISRNVVITRSSGQVASHAQKYFARQKSGKKERQRSSIHDITTHIVSPPTNQNFDSDMP